jgi:pimeloyl-ACP methyl ester carboxylesterase
MRSLLLAPLLALCLPLSLAAQEAPRAAPPMVPAARSSLVPDLPGVRRAFVTAGGARLQYLDFGGSGEPVVLLAGLGNTSWIWSDFGPRLAREGFRVVALTRRAHGESEAPGSGYHLDGLAADVVAFMDSLGFRRAHLVGHSLAGAELTRVAARYPDRVLRLVYVDAAYDRAAQQRRDTVAEPPRLAPPITAADRASPAAYLAYQRRARLDLARSWGPAVERDYLASLAVDSTGAVRWRHPLARYGEMMQGASLAAPEYGSVRAPALALYATVPQAILPPGATEEQRAQLDRFQRENHAPWVAESVAQFRSGMKLGRVEHVAGVHHLFLDRPEETLRAVRDFLRRAPRGNRE